MKKAVFNVVMTDERGSFLVDYLTKNNVSIKRIEDWGDDNGVYEVELESNTDLLQVFHAGIHFGIEKMKNQLV